MQRTLISFRLDTIFVMDTTQEEEEDMVFETRHDRDHSQIHLSRQVVAINYNSLIDYNKFQQFFIVKNCQRSFQGVCLKFWVSFYMRQSL